MQNKFHEHLDACEQCAQNPFGLCPTGANLLGAEAMLPTVADRIIGCTCGAGQSKTHASRCTAISAPVGRVLYAELTQVNTYAVTPAVAAPSPSLLELVRSAHNKLDDSIDHFTADAKSIHGLLQESMDAFERGNVPAAKELIKLAIDKECDLFGDCPAAGDEALLAALGFEPDEDTT